MYEYYFGGTDCKLLKLQHGIFAILFCSVYYDYNLYINYFSEKIQNESEWQKKLTQNGGKR